MTAFFYWFDFQSTQVLKIHFSEMYYLETTAPSAELAVSIAFGLDPFLCCALRHCHPCLCPPTASVDHVIGLSQAENKHDVQLMTLSTASALFLTQSVSCCSVTGQSNSWLRPDDLSSASGSATRAQRLCS